ncbi:MAG TPA: OmpA family protein [Thermoanaerobaculaceae bacterium]|nr:OmpA family protein [Thermoanaerobaculaceae bacterium]HPS76652.1 OmpA family protein [Thermoanaerobaculaceae bacterium]
MTTRFCNHVSALTMVVCLSGCATARSRPAPPRTVEGKVAVRVEAEPGSAEVTYRGMAVGPTPTSLNLVSLADVLAIAAERPAESWVEKRVRILSPTEIEVLFRFGKDAGPLAMRLGLERVLVFDYSSTATFDVDSYDLKSGVLPLLEEQAKLLTTAFADVDVHVCGHTDSSGSETHNLELSLRRAESVSTFLIGHGVPGERLKVLGLAAEFPLAENTTPEGKSRNRRTELVLPQ